MQVLNLESGAFVQNHQQSPHRRHHEPFILGGEESVPRPRPCCFYCASHLAGLCRSDVRLSQDSFHTAHHSHIVAGLLHMPSGYCLACDKLGGGLWRQPFEKLPAKQ